MVIPDESQVNLMTFPADWARGLDMSNELQQYRDETISYALLHSRERRLEFQWKTMSSRTLI